MSTVDTSCPICQAPLAGVGAEQAELHVNGCLDVAVLEDKKKQKRATIAQPPAAPTSSAPRASTHGAGLTAEQMLMEIEQTAMDFAAEQAGGEPVYAEQPAASGGQSNGRPLPAHKRMPHTTFTVDAFKYGELDFCTGYFLTHFHSDHYGGLTKTFRGHIYCSRITARCVVSKLGVDARLVHALPMHTRCVVHGVFVTLIDANHCPGAAILVFEVPRGHDMVRIVHTGDFRANRQHVEQISRVLNADKRRPLLPDAVLGGNAGGASPRIDYVYLDTTYLKPKYAFPQQDAVVRAVAEFCGRVDGDPSFLPGWTQARYAGSGSAAPAKITRWFRPTAAVGARRRRRTLFVVGSYTIGKERLFVEIARHLGARIYVAPAKRRMLECLGSPALLSMLAADMADAQVHVVEMSKLNVRGMAEYLQSAPGRFSGVVAFRPTGWSHAGSHYAKPEPDEEPEPLDLAPVEQALRRGDREHAAGLLARAARMAGDSAFDAGQLRARGTAGAVAVFPVPYSEHSSFAELARFVCALEAAHVVPTVSAGSAGADAAGARWLQHWQRVQRHLSKINI
ncbi:repair protein PSO2 SNM1 [Coemansia sp. RSA 2711]|nr:repair protein PSO2 SNM1 [Coemansia sp. RSA 2711]